MSAADTYTHGHHDAVLRSHRSRTLESSAAYLAPRLRPGAMLLDVGCGPGALTADLAARVAPGRALGVDLSEHVIAQARALAEERGEADRAGSAGGPVSDLAAALAA